MLQGQINGNVGWIADEVNEKNGRYFLMFTVANNYGTKNSDGTYTNHTQWVRCFLSGKLEYLEAQREKLYVGAIIFVQGPISTSLYTKDGVSRASLSITVEKVEFKAQDAAPVVPEASEEESWPIAGSEEPSIIPVADLPF